MDIRLEVMMMMLLKMMNDSFRSQSMGMDLILTMMGWSMKIVRRVAQQTVPGTNTSLTERHHSWRRNQMRKNFEMAVGNASQTGGTHRNAASSLLMNS